MNSLGWDAYSISDVGFLNRFEDFGSTRILRDTGGMPMHDSVLKLVSTAVVVRHIVGRSGVLVLGVYWQNDDSVVILLQLLCYVVAQGSPRLYPPKPNVLHCNVWKCIRRQHTFTTDRVMRRMQSSVRCNVRQGAYDYCPIVVDNDTCAPALRQITSPPNVLL